MREHAANLRSIQETLPRARARPGRTRPFRRRGPSARRTPRSRRSSRPSRTQSTSAATACRAGREARVTSRTRRLPPRTKAASQTSSRRCASADAAALPLRALQSIAQFCAAREAARAEEKEASRGEGVRRRRVGVGLLGVSGRAERVLVVVAGGEGPGRQADVRRATRVSGRLWRVSQRAGPRVR